MGVLSLYRMYRSGTDLLNIRLIPSFIRLLYLLVDMCDNPSLIPLNNIFINYCNAPHLFILHDGAVFICSSLYKGFFVSALGWGSSPLYRTGLQSCLAVCRRETAETVSAA